jgi:hypothetical protein
MGKLIGLPILRPSRPPSPALATVIHFRDGAIRRAFQQLRVVEPPCDCPFHHDDQPHDAA